MNVRVKLVYLLIDGVLYGWRKALELSVGKSIEDCVGSQEKKPKGHEYKGKDSKKTMIKGPTYRKTFSISGFLLTASIAQNTESRIKKTTMSAATP